METLPSLFSSASLPALFVLSFLAATILPLGSEWLLVVMVLQGSDPLAVVVTASLGNFLGACTTYLLGVWGSAVVIRSVLRIRDRQLAQAKRLYDRYGTWSLLFSWLPVIGDPLCLLAGIFRTSGARFGVLVFVGKFFRYATLAYVTLQGTG